MEQSKAEIVLRKFGGESNESQMEDYGEISGIYIYKYIAKITSIDLQAR